MMSEAFRKLSAAMDEAAQGMVPQELKEKGWRYVDPPTRFSPAMFDFFISLLGAGEYQLVCYSEGTNRDGEEWKRGQFLMSPAAIANLEAYRNKQ